MAKNKNGLTDKQQGFCDDIRSNQMTATDSYYKNYKVKSIKVASVCATKLLRNASVKAYMDKKQEIAEKKADYEQDEWVQDMLRLKRKCMAEEDITLVIEKLDKNDEVQRFELKQRDFNPAGANKALETFAKKFGWLADGNKEPGGNPANKTFNNWIIMPVRSLHDDADQKPVIEGKSEVVDSE